MRAGKIFINDLKELGVLGQVRVPRYLQYLRDDDLKSNRFIPLKSHCKLTKIHVRLLQA
jgi:hypothetical protein